MLRPIYYIYGKGAAMGRRIKKDKQKEEKKQGVFRKNKENKKNWKKVEKIKKSSKNACKTAWLKFLFILQ